MEVLQSNTSLPVGAESHVQFTLQSKNALYVNLESSLFSDPGDIMRFSYPADHELTAEFDEQMTPLLREYKGKASTCRCITRISRTRRRWRGLGLRVVAWAIFYFASCWKSMANAGLIAMRVIEGHRISADERKQLDSGLLAQLVIGGNLELTDGERREMPSGLMALLAIGQHLVLTRSERDRMPVGLLAQLAIGKTVRLDAAELARFEPGLRMIVEQSMRA